MVEHPPAPRARFTFRAFVRLAFGVGLVAFALPFASVSCGGHEMFTANGLNAAVGGQYTVGTQVQFYSGDVYFLLAVLGAVVGFASQLVRPYVRARAITGVVASLWSAAMLFMGQAHVNSQIHDLGSGGAVVIKWGIGFWIAVLAMVVSALMASVGLYLAAMRPKTPGIGVSAAQSGEATPEVARVPRQSAMTAGGLIAMVASLMIVAACASPYIHYTDPSLGASQLAWPSVFNPGYGPSNWFAAEPVAVAVLGFAAAVVLFDSVSLLARAIAVGVLLACGVQTFLLFVGYVALAIASPSARLGPGGVVGMVGAGLLIVAALAPARALFARDSSPIDLDSALRAGKHA